MNLIGTYTTQHHPSTVAPPSQALVYAHQAVVEIPTLELGKSSKRDALQRLIAKAKSVGREVAFLCQERSCADGVSASVCNGMA